MTQELRKKVRDNLTVLRDIKPLVHNITNYVVMNFTANILISLGASPIMAHAREEIEDIVDIAQTVVINIGTLSPHWVEAMLKAGKHANKIDVPVVLDPVGNGATGYRTEVVDELLNKVKFSVIRGNASEIIAILKSKDAGTKGVDSVHSSIEAIDIAKDIAREYNTVVVVSGKDDVITNGEEVFILKNGHQMLSNLTGTGCAATACIGAFLAIESEPLIAAICGMSVFNIAAENAARDARGPGSFLISLYDSLYNIKQSDITRKLKVEKV